MEVKNKEAFLELQSKLVTLHRQVGQLRAEIRIAERQKRKTEITLEDVKALSSQGAITYRAVGKMFLATPASELCEDLTKQLARETTSLKEMMKQQRYFEEKSADYEKNLKELIVS